MIIIHHDLNFKQIASRNVLSLSLKSKENVKTLASVRTFVLGPGIVTKFEKKFPKKQVAHEFLVRPSQNLRMMITELAWLGGDDKKVNLSFRKEENEPFFEIEFVFFSQNFDFQSLF